MTGTLARVVDAYYTTEDEGYRETMPVLHVFVRDQQWQRHHLQIDAFRPYFCVRQSEWVDKGEEVAQDDRVLGVTDTDVRGRPEQAIDGEPLVRVKVREPSDVGDLRELFDDPMEADVLYPVRFLVDFTASVPEVASDSRPSEKDDDRGVFQWIQVPDDAVEGDDPIPAEQVTVGLDESEVPEVTPPPRICTYDIEVRQGDDGPPVVTAEGTEEARNPITAITAHDSYTDDYAVWVLAHDDWTTADADAARDAVDAPVFVYANPADVARTFIEWVRERDMDVLSAWNGSGFDHPYFVNYCLNNDVNAVYSLSPTGDVRPMDGDGKWINSSLKGRLLVDLMDMYEKTLIHEPESKRLVDIADDEGVSVGKLEIEDAIDVPEGEPAIDFAWWEHPDVFVEYSHRDVATAVAINRESKEEVSIL